MKKMMTLMRGALYTAGESVADRNVHLILDQQIREAGAAVQEAKKALAIAMAHQKQEETRVTEMVNKIDKLEVRAVSALKQNKEELAREAAETIADLHSQHSDAEEACLRQQGEIDALAHSVREGERRLLDLKRRQKRAVLMERTSRLRTSAPLSGQSSLNDAAQTLSKLEERCAEMTWAADALDQIDQRDAPETLDKRLAAAGCGEPFVTPTDEVLDRLKKVADDEAPPSVGR